MFDNYEIDNILHAGLVFGLYLFISIVLYYVLSYPLDLIFNGIQAGSVGTPSESYMAWQMPGVVWGLNVAFALFLAFPIVWFVMWVFSREPDFSMFKR
jgi:hypothetical protein